MQPNPRGTLTRSNRPNSRSFPILLGRCTPDPPAEFMAPSSTMLSYGTFHDHCATLTSTSRALDFFITPRHPAATRSLDLVSLGPARMNIYYVRPRRPSGNVPVGNSRASCPQLPTYKVTNLQYGRRSRGPLGVSRTKRRMYWRLAFLRAETHDCRRSSRTARPAIWSLAVLLSRSEARAHVV